MNTVAIGSRIKDCSQGFCSFYCPQWCYIIFPPPPPLVEFLDDDGTSGPNYSPFFITIIGFLAGALLLLGYYAILANYCRSRFSATRRDHQTNNDADVEAGESNTHEPWFVATNGLDEVLVRSIGTFKYRRREGLVEGTECSVCLTEFVEDERLKLLPKCSHAFHVTCIDTWLECHSNCPLCRANIAGRPISPPPSIPPLSRSHSDRVQNSGGGENLEQGIGDEEVERVIVDAPKTPRDGEGNRRIRRSMSMDCICEPADAINGNEEDSETEESNRPCQMKTRSHNLVECELSS